MLNDKVTKGFMKYLEDAKDPNYIESIETHGTCAIHEAFNAWGYETNPGDHELIPKKDIIVELYRKDKHIAPP